MVLCNRPKLRQKLTRSTPFSSGRRGLAAGDGLPARAELRRRGVSLGPGPGEAQRASLGNRRSGLGAKKRRAGVGSFAGPKRFVNFAWLLEMVFGYFCEGRFRVWSFFCRCLGCLVLFVPLGCLIVLVVFSWLSGWVSVFNPQVSTPR